MSCQCVCETCLLGEHCDTATCAMDMPPKFQVGQRVIAKPDKILAGYYGHVAEIGWQDPCFVVVAVMGRIPGSSDRHTSNIGETFPFYDTEIEAAD